MSFQGLIAKFDSRSCFCDAGYVTIDQLFPGNLEKVNFQTKGVQNITTVFVLLPN
jgi:hypothetical protein